MPYILFRPYSVKTFCREKLMIFNKEKNCTIEKSTPFIMNVITIALIISVLGFNTFHRYCIKHFCIQYVIPYNNSGL